MCLVKIVVLHRRIDIQMRDLELENANADELWQDTNQQSQANSLRSVFDFNAHRIDSLLCELWVLR